MSMFGTSGGMNMTLVYMHVKNEDALPEDSIREIIIDGSHANMRRLIIAMLERIHEKPVDKLTFQFWQDTTYVQYQCKSKVFSSKYNLSYNTPVKEQLESCVEEGYSKWGLNP